MSAPFRFKFKQQTLWLSASRCIFWEEERILIVSDLHFGKSGHFRKSGIGIPQNIFKNDLQRLFSQIEFFKPKILLVTGDMFHSTANKEIDLFLKWRMDISHVEFYLVRGNHYILNKAFYQKAGIRVFENKLSIGSFCFTHDISSHCDETKGSLFTFSGHIHPGIKMNGPGGQSLMLPCFYFGDEHAVLPAFSQFTGLSKMRPLAKDQVFAIVGDEIMKM